MDASCTVQKPRSRYLQLWMKRRHSRSFTISWKPRGLTRMEGVALLLALCKISPKLISTNIAQVCRVSSLFLPFSSFPKPVALQLIQRVLALHPGCLGQAGPSYPDQFKSGPGFRTRSFSPAVFVWQVPIAAVHQMMTEFSTGVTSAVSYSWLG